MLIGQDYGSGCLSLDVERAASILQCNARIVKDGTETGPREDLQGSLLAHEVLPGLFSIGQRLSFATKHSLENELEGVLSCFFTVSGHLPAIEVGNLAPTQFKNGQTLTVCADGATDCRSHLEEGHHGTFVGFMITKQWLSEIDDEDVSFNGVKAQFYKGLSQEKVVSLPSLVSLGAEMQNPSLTGYARQLFIEGCTIAAVAELAAFFSNTDGQRIGLSERNRQHAMQAKEILDDRLANPPSMQELCFEIGANPTTLGKSFQAVFGDTVFGYLKQQQLEAAKLLLLETGLPVGDIAAAIGISTAGAIATAFRRQRGVSQLSLRRKGK